MNRTTFTAMLTALTMTFALQVSRADAINCGDTLGPGGSFTLTADLGPCATDAALTVQGPTVLDLGGRTISCESALFTQIGIQIIGKGAVVRNGRVIDCGWGVVVLGGGGHQIRSVLSELNAVGFYIGSSNNALRENGTVGLAGFSDGFFVQGDSNVFTGNVATGWGRAFFVAAGCTFVCGTASHNTFTNNSVIVNTDAGFYLVSATKNSINSNKVFVNGMRTENCCQGGIHLDSESTRNSISENVSLGNRGNDVFDLRDDNAGCDANIWTNNVFGTRNQDCIR